jgi:Zn-dependent protease with chaperone function
MIRTTNGNTYRDITSPDITHPSVVIETAEQFNVWKGRLLRKLRSVDLVVKIALSLPLFMPAFLIWSIYYWASKIKVAIWTEPGSYIMIIAFVLIFPYYYYFKGLAKLSRRHKKKKRFIKIDWSKQKYQELANAITNSGVNIAKITGELAVDDGWNIHIYPRPREFLTNRMGRQILLFNGLLLVLLLYLDWPSVWIFLLLSQGIALLLLIGILLTLDLIRPRLTLVLTTRVLTLLKGEPEKFRLVVSHEVSHIRHRDPVSRVIWEDRESTGAFLIFWFAISFIFLAMVGKNIASAWVFISCMFGWLIVLFLISDLIPLLQELRADLEAIKSTAERELLIQVLRVIPIESKHQSYLNSNISLKQFLSVIKDASHHFRIDDQKEVMRQRIAMLETGEISLINEGRLHLKFLLYYVVAITTLITSQIYLSRVVIVP